VDPALQQQGLQPVVQQRGRRIFSILDYIESNWGVGMRLFPVQRFIVKLYYNLPLDSRDRNIVISDMFNQKTVYRFTELEYLKFLYEEGRCNINEQDHDRRELLLAIGRRGGKCLRECSVVLTNDGFREIQELGDPDGPEYQPLKVGVAQEGARRSTSAYFYNGGEQDTVRVRSRCGYEIEGTHNHRIKVLGEDGTIQWRYLPDIRVGDRLGIHRKTDLWARRPVDTTPFTKGLNGRKKVRFPSEFNESWATLLGALVGDGTWGLPDSIEVTVGPYPEWRAQVQGLFCLTLGGTKYSPDKRTNGTGQVQFFSTAARQFLDRLGYRLDAESSTKRIPWVVWRSPKPVVAAFLRGLFETDGCAESGGRKVSLSTASTKLAAEVQLLLLNFGVVSRIKPRWNKKYKKWYQHLQVLGADSLRIFATSIGFLSSRKNALLQAHIDKGDLGNKSATESIPHQRAWCRRLLESVPKNNGNSACGKLGWRRSLLRAALGNVIKNSSEDLSYPRLRAALVVAREVGADSEAISHFEKLLDAGYFYDEVVEVTPSHGRVYDLTVPDGESFVANGMTNHNTLLSSIFASYEIYRLLNLENPQEYYGLPNGDRIQIISVATDKDQAGILFNGVTTHLNRCEYFKPFIANNTQSLINFRTPADIARYGQTVRHENGKFVSFMGKATLRVTFKSCIAKGLRGSGNIVIILDEMAHFKDQGQSSAADIYEAITPSTAAYSPKDPTNNQQTIGSVESRVICISSPLNKSGKFFELYHLAMSRGRGSENMIAIQAPTWEVNPTIDSQYYKQRYHSDPVSFMTEHGAQFSDRVRGWVERETDLLACVDPELRPKDMGTPRYPHQMGIDVGLIGDGTAIVVTHAEQRRLLEDGHIVDRDMIVLDYHEYWMAGVDWRETNPHLDLRNCVGYARNLKDVERLDFDEIATWISNLTKRFYITEGTFDRWNGLPLEGSLHKRGLIQFKSEFFKRELSSNIFQTTKLMMFDRRLQLYDWPPGEKGKHSPFIQELLTLQAEQVSRNVVVVEAPQTAGYHDDVSDAFVRAVYLSSQKMGGRARTMGPGVSGYAPAPPSAMTTARYQLMRAKRHGGFGDRMRPTASGLRLRGR
jgi:intein/homing endonuclease